MKIKIAFCLALVCMLCCCGKKTGVKPQLTDITFDAEAEYDGVEYLCSVQTDSELNMEINVNSPQELSGMIVKLSDGKLTVEYKGMTYAPENGEKTGGIVNNLYRAVIDSAEEKAVYKDGNNCVISGESDGFKYDFFFSPTGLPLYLNMGDGLCVQFNNVTVKDVDLSQ